MWIMLVFAVGAERGTDAGHSSTQSSQVVITSHSTTQRSASIVVVTRLTSLRSRIHRRHPVVHAGTAQRASPARLLHAKPTRQSRPHPDSDDRQQPPARRLQENDFDVVDQQRQVQHPQPAGQDRSRRHRPVLVFAHTLPSRQTAVCVLRPTFHDVADHDVIIASDATFAVAT